MAIKESEQVSAPPGEELPAERALLERPSISIRSRIILAFALAMFFSFSIGIVSIVFISRMDSKQVFFEQAENFSSEIQQARRYEKNYFLYGSRSDLYDALSHIRTADLILENNSEIRSVLKESAFAALTNNLNKYESLLNRLAAKDNGADTSGSTRDPDIEDQLRHFGHRILTYAADMVKQERTNMHNTASSVKLVAVFALIVIFIVMIWVASELTHQILRPLGRAVEYTQRIARGDSPRSPLSASIATSSPFSPSPSTG